MPASEFVSGFPAAFCLPGEVEESVDFHNQMLCGLLFLTLVLQPREPGMGLRPSLLKRGPTAEIPSGFLTTTCGCRASLFHVSASPTSLSMASSANSDYRTSAQLLFRWLSMID